VSEILVQMQYLELISDLILGLNLSFSFKLSKSGMGSIVGPASFWTFRKPPPDGDRPLFACGRLPPKNLQSVLEKAVLRTNVVHLILSSNFLFSRAVDGLRHLVL
jgi:hypothetical protein